MNKERKYQSEQLMVCHEDAEALYRIGVVSEAEMREFDQDCLIQENESPLGSPTARQQAPATA